MVGLLGKKLGMTHVFGEDGRFISVTVIEAGPCPIIGMNQKSIRIGFDSCKEKHLKKPLLGTYKKANVSPCKLIKEFLKEPAKEYKIGEEVKVDLFKSGDFVDITGNSIGKGFQGGMKRWNWHGGPQTHGSTSRRRIGSIGSSTTPGRVWKGHHLPGHMGNHRMTVQNLKVVKIDAENNLLMVKGAVPGHKNSYLIIRRAKKKKLQTTDKPSNG
ncbi:MAG: 50S ribosomal protein L3 [Candidatus Omnitrophica bacterium]|nr:50S ribosomal protein L3 [Candidatus Omnitrophota bacterium]MDD5238481.1 50S ribosomal protein L3 [Candidatus Omnitrophota bacterium]